MAATRANETTRQRQQRIDEQRERQATIRANESQEERQLRRDTERARQETNRALATADERQLRRDTERARQVSRRENASQEEQQQIRDADIQRLRAPHRTKELARGAFNYDKDFKYHEHEKVKIGTIHDVVCKWCSAHKFKGETEGMCCGNGKVDLDPLRTPPEPLKSLLDGDTHFRKNCRAYNSTFQMTSLGAKEVRESGFMPTYRVQGQIHHSIGSLLPLPNESAKFLQLYFVGSAEANLRHSLYPNTKMEVILDLQEMLHQVNPYVKDFKYYLDHPPPPNVKLTIDPNKRPQGVHRGRLNAPVCSEVAAIVAGGDFAGKREIIIETRDSRLKRICETHRSYDALQYPLLLPYGDDGYHTQIKQTDPETKHEHSTVYMNA